MIKAIIVDDERGAYINLNELLSSYCKNVNVVGYASNTEEAEGLIRTEQPDLIFLDIKMPRETGIEFIKRIWPINFEVIFVTAYDEFAIKVFKLNALDYILKPISINYLMESMARAEETILSKPQQLQPAEDERYLTEDDKSLTSSIVLKSGNAQRRFDFEQITYLHASGSYTSFYIQKSKSITTGYNLAHYDDILPQDIFVRTHKSYIVNINCVKEISMKDGVPYCKLRNDELIPISRRRLSTIKSMFK